MDKAKLIFKVLDKQATDSEIAELKTWISANEGNRSEYESLKLLWGDARVNTEGDADNSHEQGFLAIKAAIRKKRHKRKRRRLAVVGLMVIIILIIAYLLVSVSPSTDGRATEAIRFDKASLRQVIAVLEKKYNVEIEAQDNLLDCKFSGSFYNDSPEHAIKVIAERLNANYTIAIDRRFRIDGRGCNEKGKTDLIVSLKFKINRPVFVLMSQGHVSKYKIRITGDRKNHLRGGGKA